MSEIQEPSAHLISEQSRKAVLRKAKDEWLDFFADDGIIEDPVGKSPLDPDGKGHRGKDAISAFWDENIANSTIEFNFRDSFDTGKEIAYVGSLKITGEKGSLLGEGTVVDVEGVYIYKVNDDGKIVSLKAYWDYERVMGGLGYTAY